MSLGYRLLGYSVTRRGAYAQAQQIADYYKGNATVSKVYAWAVMPAYGPLADATYVRQTTEAAAW